VWARIRARFLGNGGAENGTGCSAKCEGAMNTGVTDNFTNVFTTYIDSGFGLLKGEVAYLASTLIVIDITLAGLFWAWDRRTLDRIASLLALFDETGITTLGGSKVLVGTSAATRDSTVVERLKTAGVVRAHSRRQRKLR
jgi:hypothetical protein